MKHIITVNGKPFEELTLDERRQLDLAIINSAKKRFGLILHLEEERYFSKE